MNPEWSKARGDGYRQLVLKSRAIASVWSEGNGCYTANIAFQNFYLRLNSEFVSQKAAMNFTEVAVKGLLIPR